MVAVFVLLLLPWAMACDSTSGRLRREMQERRLENIGMKEVDPSGEAAEAGISVLRNPDLRPINPKRIGADTTSQGFHRYVHRCGACHSAPDPSLHSASEWRSVSPRMEKHMEEAGLIPLGPTDRTVILEFLQRHADGR